LEPRTRADGLGGLDVAASGEDAQPTPEDPFLLAEQSVAPVDRGAEGLAPREVVPPVDRQQPKAVVETLEQILRSHRRQPHGGQPRPPAAPPPPDGSSRSRPRGPPRRARSSVLPPPRGRPAP